MTNTTITLRHRTAAVIFLSAVSMLGCFVWWGRLPLGGSSSSSSSELKQHPNASLEDDAYQTPPPLNFESSWVGDDDQSEEQQQQGERVRGKDVKKQKQKKKTSTTSSSAAQSIDSSLETTSDAPNNYSWENYKSRPKIVWLMSYPNSGTSYTMTMVSRASNRATASNYGREVAGPGVPNTPLYPDQWNGPYYRPEPRKPLPKDYILVKTHCGGRCVTCGPEKYVLNETEFLDECRRGSGYFAKRRRRRLEEISSDESGSVDSGPGAHTVHYDANLVKKAVHLFRNPFHNIVSRFHLERKHYVEHNKEYEVNRYPNNEVGFQQWCKDLNKVYGPKPSSNQKILASDVVQLMQKVPCHGEVYKYVQWHNMARAVTAKKPTLVLHYENYDQKWNQTAAKILDFLHLEFEGVRKEFSARHDYDPYFTSSQKRATKALVQRLASESVWKQLERYFD